MTLHRKPVYGQERFLKYYGSKISSELLFPKNRFENTETGTGYYQGSDQFAESNRLDDVADKQGTRMRSKSIAAVAALWQEEEGYPSDDFLRGAAPDPEMPDVKQS